MSPRNFCSVVVPHAGWFFSGRLACRTISRIRCSGGTVVVVGGHLRPGDPLIIADEDAFSTPAGDLEVDTELADAVRQSFPCEPERYRDNTVEVQLPFVAHLLPGSRVVYLRCPPSEIADDLGRFLADRWSDERCIAVIGSTDLTHYGPSYGFTDHGTGDSALRWMKEVNDNRFISALQRMDPGEITRIAGSDRSACSSGAAATAAAFATARGCSDAELIDYYTSADIMANDSFVGYVGIGYGRPGF